jgi:chromate reductase
MHKVAVLVGSLRRESINLKFAKALAKLARPKLDFTFVEIGDLPLYNEDLWQAPPASVLRLKADIAAADAVLFVTPEYNRSVPGVLKNAIDWGTRPWGQNSWAGKPASIIGTSPGNIGSALAQAHLGNILSHIGMLVLGQPEVFFVTKPGLIDEDGTVTDDTTRAFLEGYLAKFAAWIGRFAEREALAA